MLIRQYRKSQILVLLSDENATVLLILILNCISANHKFNFYRAMHFSAKRGIAIMCRLSVRPSVSPSVCLSVCDVGEL